MYKISLNSKLSLLEIIMSLLIFAACSILMLNIFGIARFTQMRANDKTIASSIIQSDLEIIKSLNTIEEVYEFLNESYEVKNLANSNYTYSKYYDKDWNQKACDEYSVTLRLSDHRLKSGDLLEITILAEKKEPYPFISEGQEVYSVKSKKFLPLYGGSHAQ